MKELQLLILSIAFVPILKAQSTENLEAKNGFKEFTLGDPYTRWKAQCTFEALYENNTKGYTYEGACCYRVFNYDIDEIILRFNSDTLVGIDITTVKLQKGYTESGNYTMWREDDVESLKQSFSYLFGKPTSESLSKSSGDLIYEWTGEKVYLLLVYDYLGPLKGDRILISVVNLDFLKRSIQEGF